MIPLELRKGWEPAHPVPHSPHTGLSKREYMALHILGGSFSVTPDGRLPSVADAVRLADRLLEELAK
jgi:hypothetical protein